MKNLLKRSQHWGAIAFVGCFAMVSLALLSAFGRLSITTTAAAICVSLVMEAVRQMKIFELRRRIAQNRAVVWTVVVNQISAGKISDGEYAKLSLDAVLDARNYVAQAVQVGRLVFRAGVILFIAVPCLFVWIAIVAAALAPADFAATLASLPTVSAGDISKLASTLFSVAGEVLIVAMGAWFAFSGRTGWINEFGEDQARRLRLHTQTSAVGRVTMVAKHPVARANASI